MELKGGAEESFDTSKKLLILFDLLVHFDPKLDTVLACDASSYGVGAVLAHRMPDGSERPVGYVSKTLSPAERNHSQLERHAFSESSVSTPTCLVIRLS